MRARALLVIFILFVCICCVFFSMRAAFRWGFRLREPQFARNYAWMCQQIQWGQNLLTVKGWKDLVGSLEFSTQRYKVGVAEWMICLLVPGEYWDLRYLRHFVVFSFFVPMNCEVSWRKRPLLLPSMYFFNIRNNLLTIIRFCICMSGGRNVIK